jgi:CRP-like cAMP-binding protein
MDVSMLEQALARLTIPLVPNPTVQAAFRSTLRERTLTKGQHLFREGDTGEALYFIRTGLLRYYYLAEGVEHTGQFFDEGKFVGDVFALTTGAPGLQNIDALEPTAVIVIPLTALTASYEADHAFERFGRRLMEEAMAGSQRRTATLLKLSPEDRYTRFVTTRPEIARRVPQYIVASYLGITPEALSRIRRRRLAP